MRGRWAGLALIRCASGRDESPRRTALEAAYGAEFREVGFPPDSEIVGHIPSVQLSPGPRGKRSITVHGESWGDVLDALEEIIDFPPDRRGGNAPGGNRPGGDHPAAPGG